MKFSRRLPAELRPNILATTLDEMRRAGVRILDLTESNPTRAGIEYPSGLVEALADVRALRYEPEPFGLALAREAIAHEFGAPFDRVALAASTSELYSWLFKLLCDPGDEVLTPRPSYPLFEHLAALESVAIRSYALFYDYGWFIDFQTLRDAMTERTRAVVVVSPNNPTGNFVRRREWEELTAICAERGVAVIADEVFQDYALEESSQRLDALACPVFRLNGLSKTVGLPQMKLAWMIAEGPENEVAPALARLEIIADTYLSAGTPVQCAAESLLKVREPVQRQILARLRENLALVNGSGLRVLRVDAGWYAITTLPPRLPEEETTERLLRERKVLVQPGYFYDFERSGYLVLSLLTPPDVFREGVHAILSL
ncbi:MAG TPA: pyridoxal phosphate-dependent aminotransferase [Bryobacteraceae bacterium]|nr:pyridoxal phosphate-dependent aminotransferase [Bryobacteraceae bacterium]